MSPSPASLYLPKLPQVLVVDDQPANLTALEALLAPLDLPVVMESSGEGALRRLLYEDFAVVLLDVQMPGLDGFDTARLIRAVERTRHLPIIFVTAIDREQKHMFRGYREGAVDYLTKPLDPDILRSKVSVFAQLFQKNETIRAREALIFKQQQEAWKNDLVSAVSHELRTPLNAILSWAQLLREGGLDETQTKRGLEVIERNARIQAALIGDVLDVSRITAGALEIDRAPVELRAAVAAAVEAARSTAEAKGLSLTAELGDREASVHADAVRIAQVLGKLLVNATQATPQTGSIHVSLSFEEGHACIEVKDTGSGIPATMLPEIFDRFRRLPPEKRAPRGLGLGLFLAQALCRLHGGEITAASAGEGQGAAFKVRLPLL